MAIGITLLLVVAVIIVIWVLIEVKRMRHKIFAVLLIALILFSYISASLIFRGQDVDFKTIPGIVTATRLYFSWLGTVFVNLKKITANVIKMDWKTNKTVEDIEEKPLIEFEKNKK